MEKFKIVNKGTLIANSVDLAGALRTAGIFGAEAGRFLRGDVAVPRAIADTVRNAKIIGVGRKIAAGKKRGPGVMKLDSSVKKPTALRAAEIALQQYINDAIEVVKEEKLDEEMVVGMVNDLCHPINRIMSNGQPVLLEAVLRIANQTLANFEHSMCEQLGHVARLNS